MKQSFEVIIQSERLTYVEVPKDVTSKFNKKGKLNVKGEIDGCSYQKSLLSRGGGVYILTLNKEFMKKANLSIGDKVNITMELDTKDASTQTDIRDHEDIIQYHQSAQQKRESGLEMDVLEAIFTRRSIRKFKDEMIENSVLDTIIKAGCYAPTAENKQPWHFIVVKDNEVLENIASFHPHAKMVPQAGCVIVVCGDKTKQPQSGLLVEDCSAAIQNMLLASHGLGLGAVWCALYPFTHLTKPTKQLLNLPEEIVPVGLIAVGKPAEEKRIVYRYDKAKVHFEKW